MKALPRDLTAGVVASAGFLGAMAVLSFPMWVAAPASLALYLGVRLAIPRDPDDSEVTVTPGITLEQAKAMLSDGRRRAVRFREVAAAIRDRAIRIKVEEMAQVIDDLFKSVEEDPKNLVAVHGFLTDHIDRALEIVEDYARLAAKPHLDESTLARVARTAKVIEEVCAAVKAQYLSIVNNELTELDTAGRVLRNIMDVEGPGAGLDDLDKSGRT
jgi:hypothetical protein